MFFDPRDYLQSDPEQAGSQRERERLWREAEQRAKLCEATTRLAAAGGLEAAAIHLAARSAGIGQGTYYKLYDSKEACLREAFERCAAVLMRRIERALSEKAAPGNAAMASLRCAVETLGADANVARLLLSVIRAGGAPGREAQQRWLDELAELLARHCRERDVAGQAPTAQLVLGGLCTLLAARVSGGKAEDLERALPELTYTALAPYLGVEVASAAMRRCQEELIREGGRR